MRRTVGILTLILFSMRGVSAPQDSGGASSGWAKSYGTSDREELGCVLPTQDGGALAVGTVGTFISSNQDAWVFKLSPTGAIQWQKRFGLTSPETATHVVATSDGGFLVVGTLWWGFGAQEADVWILKLSSTGSLEWAKRYGGPGDEYARTVKNTSDGGYVVLASTSSFGVGTPAQPWIFKIDGQGNLVWQKSLSASTAGVLYDLVPTASGGWLAVGTKYTSPSHMWVVQFTSNGDIEWQFTYGGGSYDEGLGAATTEDGGFLIAGHTLSFGASGDGFLVKIDSSGSVEWARKYGAPGVWQGFNAILKAPGGYFLAGYTEKLSGSSSDNLSLDAWLLQIDAQGKVLWQRKYGGLHDDVALNMAIGADGRLWVGGYTKSFGAGDMDAWILTPSASDGKLGSLGVETTTESSAVTVGGVATSSSTIVTTATPADTNNVPVTPGQATVSQQAP